jgi:hypothetical protein
MAVLNKPWGSMTQVASTDDAVVTGEDGAEAAKTEPKPLARPLFIYVTDGQVDPVFDKVEKVVLMNDSVCIGMWAFECVKMSPEDVAKDALLADEGKEVPRFIFVSRDRKDIAPIEGSKMKAKTVLKTMDKFARKAYGVSVTKRAKAMIKVLGEFDKIANEKKMLEAKIAREEGKADKKLEKKQEELVEREKKANEEKAELLTFEPKALT